MCGSNRLLAQRESYVLQNSTWSFIPYRELHVQDFSPTTPASRYKMNSSLQRVTVHFSYLSQNDMLLRSIVIIFHQELRSRNYLLFWICSSIWYLLNSPLCHSNSLSSVLRHQSSVARSVSRSIDPFGTQIEHRCVPPRTEIHPALNLVERELGSNAVVLKPRSRCLEPALELCGG